MRRRLMTENAPEQDDITCIHQIYDAANGLPWSYRRGSAAPRHPMCARDKYIYTSIYMEHIGCFSGRALMLSSACVCVFNNNTYTYKRAYKNHQFCMRVELNRRAPAEAILFIYTYARTMRLISILLLWI